MCKLFIDSEIDTMTIASKSGVTQCILGGWILAKLATLCYNNNVNIQK